MTEPASDLEEKLDEEYPGWRDTAAELQAHGVPERRAEVAALIDAGATHQQISDLMGISRGNVSNHVQEYRSDRADYDQLAEDYQWLAEHAPEI